ncbi:hypothetical protein [Kitasatospora cinereorecta]|uniref:ATPase AAA-type core domain-containing protein n=1 Tax=Kitasatospora cinereorecta TaxID=285560 RepID=A0ABW0V3V4_9ACTN
MGDATIDWAISIDQKYPLEFEQRLKAEAHACWHKGGVLLLRDLIERAVARQLGSSISSPHICPSADYWKIGREPGIHNLRLHHTYNLLCRVPGAAEQWRMDQFLGIRFAAVHPQQYDMEGAGPLSAIVIEDAALGGAGEIQPQAVLNMLDDHESPVVIMKLGGSSLKRELWSNLLEKRLGDVNPKTGLSESGLAKKLVIVMKADSLRDAGAEISRDLSWERSAQDILAEIQRNAALKSLKRCRRIVITFGPTGALIIDNDFEDRRYTLVFDKELMEGSWSWKNEKSGRMFGYSQLLVAELVARLVDCSIRNSTGGEGYPAIFNRSLVDGSKHALVEMRRVHELGFARDGEKLEFPVSALEPPGANGECVIEVANVKSPMVLDPPPTETWSFLQQELDGNDPYDLARKIVYGGAEELRNVPTAQFGHLQTADRREIEGLRSLRRLITDYWDAAEADRNLDKKGGVSPRSIAVFGSPGDGKSFAVRQVVSWLREERGERPLDPLEFNLSQFESSTDLYAAFHLVRDRFLDGEIPLVFWDEFDTPLMGLPLGWIRYFLAPMYEGTFQQAQVIHPIGRAIFIFAGGVYGSFDEFVERTSVPSFDGSKAPDFISRLSGYLDIVSPNPQRGKLIDEPHRIIHRALLLHKLLLGANIRSRQDVDSDVVRAFLEIPMYRHGARSMRAIIEMSRLHRGGRFSRSALPPPTQLNLHVDAEEFLRLARHEHLAELDL